MLFGFPMVANTFLRLRVKVIKVFVLEGLGWLRGSSMAVCEALCDIACKKGSTNIFDT